MCRLKGHNHPLKDHENDPNSKNYNRTHYPKIRDQECNGPSTNKSDVKIFEDEASLKKRELARPRGLPHSDARTGRKPSRPDSPSIAPPLAHGVATR